MDEFALIEHYFARAPIGAEVITGIGDDCAVLRIPAGRDLVVSIDTMVEGVHFPAQSSAERIGSRAICTALSDLAAMGAQPHWITLALTLPESDPHWLAGFSEGLLGVANKFECHLVGGDTTRGPLTISVQVHGSVEPGKALRRAGAQPDDMIFVTGCLGDGGAALKLINCEITVTADAQDYLYKRFYAPTPRIREGEMLVGIASAAIDISDGLVADLQKLLEASGVGAVVDAERLPISEMWREATHQDNALKWATTAGDDYELCFTVPKKNLAKVQGLIKQGRLNATPIGKVTNKLDFSIFRSGRAIDASDWAAATGKGYNHFA